MQHNFQHKSHLIRATEEAKRKSRHRLLGSIFLLLIALVVLLNVTSKIKPIPVDPQNIEIKSTQAKNTAIESQNNTVTLNQAQEVPHSNNISSSTISDIHDNPKNIQALNQTIESIATNSIESQKEPSSPFKLRIITENKKQVMPEDILNGTYSEEKQEQYFIQLIASDDKDKLSKLQKSLNRNNISTFIQPVITTNGTVYRLRMGPFKNKDEANKNLTKIANLQINSDN